MNEAQVKGGTDLLIDTIETNFRIKIDNYMKIDFFAFMEVVDALGGVEMTITDEEVENMNLYLEKEINPRFLERPVETDVLEEGGTYVLNGAQTLAYVRCRYVSGAEFGRTGRQRKVLTVLFERFKECSLAEMMDVVEVVLPNVTTDISEDKLLSLITNAALEYKDYELVSQSMPFDGTWRGWIHELHGDKKEVLSIDIELNSQQLIQSIYGVDLSEEDEITEEEISEE